MDTLTLHEVEQLVALRLTLEDALSRAIAGRKYRRGSAVVALDATVERASSIVAVTRGIVIPTNGKLDDLISRLVQDFGSIWKPSVLPDIKHLRRARNASQHEGLEPDREQVPLWASATSTYVSSLIDAQFGVDIGRVVLSDAIQDDELRDFMRQAEVAKDSGNYRLCADMAKVAYGKALRMWNRLRPGGSAGFEPSRNEIFDQKGYDYLLKQLKRIQGALEAAVFAGDVAETEWFISAINERGDVLDVEDAERILTFAFEWIVECERAVASWTPNRQYRAAVSRRIVRRYDCPARIDECISVDLRTDRIRALFRVADVPDEPEYGRWAETLREHLPPRGQDIWWWVSDDGTVEVEKKLDEPMDFSVEVSHLATALYQTYGAVQLKLNDSIKSDLSIQQRQEEFAESLLPIRAVLPSWVEDIEWSNDGFGEVGEQLLVSVTEDVLMLRFGERSKNGFFDDRKSLQDIVRSNELVRECYGTLDRNKLALAPVLGAQQLAGVFIDVDKIVQEQLEIEHRLNCARDEAVKGARVSIASKMAELSEASRPGDS